MSNSVLSPALQQNQSGLLWLTHEQLPHPDAVICPADENQVQLAITLLKDTHQRRMGILQRLKGIANKLATIPPIERPSIPARMPNGLYEPISWRFALWLSHALAIQEDSRREALIVRLQYWLSAGEDCDLVSTDFYKVEAANAAEAGSPDREVGGPGSSEIREVRRTGSNRSMDAHINHAQSAGPSDLGASRQHNSPT